MPETGKPPELPARRTRVSVNVRVAGENTPLGVSRNISATGVYVSLSREHRAARSAPEVGATIHLTMRLFEDEGRLETTGRVVRHQLDPDTKAVLGVGIRFVDLSPDVIEAITAYVETRMSTAKALVAGLPDAAILLDADLKAIYYNSLYIGLSGLRRSQLRSQLADGVSPFEILGSGDLAADAELARKALTSGRSKRLAQFEYKNIAGDTFVGMLSMVPIIDESDHQLGVMTIFRDESAETRVQTRYMNMVTLERSRADRLEALVTGVAHQLNTPLGVIKMALSSLEDDIKRLDGTGGDSSVSEDLQAAASLMNSNIDRLGRVISDFKLLSSSQLVDERSSANLVETISDAIALSNELLQSRGLSLAFESEEPSEVPWDGYHGHLRTILCAIIRNAAEHGYAGGVLGDIQLRLKRVTYRDAFHIEIEDHGQGIDASEVASVFDPFVTRTPGTHVGLGLTVAKNLAVHFLQGSIRCHSSLGEGTTIYLEFPTQLQADELSPAEGTGRNYRLWGD